MKNNPLFQVNVKALISAIFLSIIIPFAATGQVYPHHKLAPTPPMGWNAWFCFFTDVSEARIKKIADVMVSDGYRDAGYQYLVIDDGWQAPTRSPDGSIEGDPKKFPNGMKAVADYVHSKGLKFGIYTGPGLTTCAGYIGSQGYEQKDLETYASWGVDFLKLDYCSGGIGTPEEQAALWRKELDKLKRPIVLSLSFGEEAYLYATKYANLWRTTTDMVYAWDMAITETRRGSLGLPCSVVAVIDQQPGLERYQQPGAFNDPDMMQIGNGCLSYEENKSHFSMWAILGAPLMMGTDLRKISPELKKILTNKEVIDINQDPLCFQGRKISDTGEDFSRAERNYGLEIWVKKLSKKGEFAIALLNRSEYEEKMRISWSDIGLADKGVSVRDLWKHEDVGIHNDSYSSVIQPHGVVMLKVKGEVKGEMKQIFPVVTDSVIAEAEKGLLSRAVKDADTYPGYSGKGYVQYNSNIPWRFIRLVVNVPSDGMYKVGLRYANLNDRSAKVYFVCNGNNFEIECPVISTPGSYWNTAYTSIYLKSGLNVIKICSHEVWCPLIDYLVVKPG